MEHFLCAIQCVCGWILTKCWISPSPNVLSWLEMPHKSSWWPRTVCSKGEFELPLVIPFPPLYTATALVLIFHFSSELVPVAS